MYVYLLASHACSFVLPDSHCLAGTTVGSQGYGYIFCFAVTCGITLGPASYVYHCCLNSVVLQKFVLHPYYLGPALMRSVIKNNYLPALQLN
ncbi:hypothetical protein EDD85DRAFT_582811 [Armillaria nabsnona]|nr:hypothetical protein EDD85DRAFT_582811 [Armillaria nabsnona]